MRQSFCQDPSEVLTLILDFGLVSFAKKFKYTLFEVARQLLYAIYRDADDIQISLFKIFQTYIEEGKVNIDPYNNGFESKSFNPMRTIYEVLDLFENNPSFKENSILRYQISQANDFFGIGNFTNDSTISNYIQGLEYKNEFESHYGRDCWPSIKPEQIIDFAQPDKDLDLFRVYISLKSIIGRKNFDCTHKSVILSRMLGCKSKAALNNFLQNNSSARQYYKKYSGRKRMDNLLRKAVERGFITILTKKHVSGVYISTKIRTQSELEAAIRSSGEMYKIHNQFLSRRDLE